MSDKENEENGSNGTRMWQVAGGAVMVVGLITLVRSIPDIIRYMKMRSM